MSFSQVGVKIQYDTFDPGEQQRILVEKATNPGGVVAFTGYVRCVDEGGEPLSNLYIEHYPGMTESYIEKILHQAISRWNIEVISVLHRIGVLKPLEPIVWLGVCSEHRANSFSACEFVMDCLKTQAPFWKKEQSKCSGKWLKVKKVDEDRVARWSQFFKGIQ